MERAIIVKGRLNDSGHIELDEPIEGIVGPIEIVVRALAPSPPGEDVLDYLARIERGTRTKPDIDGDVAKEREAWERPDGWPWRKEA